MQSLYLFIIIINLGGAGGRGGCKQGQFGRCANGELGNTKILFYITDNNKRYLPCHCLL